MGRKTVLLERRIIAIQEVVSTISPRIREMPAEERPREKMAERGVGALTDAEILALFFGSGLPGKSAIEMGRDMLARFGSLHGIAKSTTSELMEVEGVGPAKAGHLAAVCEFGRRLGRERFQKEKLDTAQKIYDLLGYEMGTLHQESLRVVLLDVKFGLLGIEEITRGTVSETIAHPREIFRPAIVHGASFFALVHNHPSGDPTPSGADLEITKRIARAASLMGITFFDHIIVGSPGDSDDPPYFSFNEAGMIP